MNLQTTLTTLWQGASYQDHLLQSYRKLHVLLQSVLLIIAVGLAVVILLFDHMDRTVTLYAMLLVFTALGIYLLVVMSKLIKARAADVDYYHNQIIECEKALPKEEQVLTAFKVHQKYGRNKDVNKEFFRQFELTDEIRSKLTEKGKGHTRKVIDRNLAICFFILWISLHIVIILNWRF